MIVAPKSWVVLPRQLGRSPNYARCCDIRPPALVYLWWHGRADALTHGAKYGVRTTLVIFHKDALTSTFRVPIVVFASWCSNIDNSSSSTPRLLVFPPPCLGAAAFALRLSLVVTARFIAIAL